jgi:hypothetical protein
MHCMVCNGHIPAHRRLPGFWFCSGRHHDIGSANGLIERSHRERENGDWVHKRNPTDPMRCYECGKKIGPARRLFARWYCTHACYEEDTNSAGASESSGSRRWWMALAVAAAGGTYLASQTGGAFVPAVPSFSLPAWSDLFGAKEYEFAFGDASALLAQWRDAENAWRSGDGVWKPLRSMTSRLVKEFVNGAVEVTALGGAGFLAKAADDLSSFHSVAFQPVRGRGRIADYQLLRTTWIDSRRSVVWAPLPLHASAKYRGEKTSFRIYKRGNYFEASLAEPGGPWSIVQDWREEKLHDGRVGLFVGEGHEYSVVSGRITG